MDKERNEGEKKPKKTIGLVHLNVFFLTKKII
jgi:hypothetical protein